MSSNDTHNTHNTHDAQIADLLEQVKMLKEENCALRYSLSRFQVEIQMLRNEA